MTAALFWTILVALAALAVSVVLRPLWTDLAQAPADDPGQIYRAQLVEITRDLARGTIVQAEADRLRAEVARRLLDLDRKAAAPSRRAMTPKARVLTALLVGAVGLGTLALYARIGQPGMPDMARADRLAAAEAAYQNRPTQAAAEAQAPARQVNPDPELLALLDQLRGVLADRQDDQQGLQFLAEYEARAGNFAAAAAAQSRLIALKTPATAEDHAMLAQHMIFAAGDIVTPQAEAELAAALAIDPSNARATYFLGLMFAQTGRPDKTLPLWQGLLYAESDTAPWSGPIRATIQDIAAAAGQRFEMPPLNGPTAADAEAAAGMAAEDRAAMIDGMVKGLEDRLLTNGGSLDEWRQLLQALSVLGDAPRAARARAAGELALAATPADLDEFRRLADELGIAP